jgi:hypothetical protein
MCLAQVGTEGVEPRTPPPKLHRLHQIRRGWDGRRKRRRLADPPIPRFARHHLRPLGSNATLRVGPNGDSSPLTEGVGFEPTRASRPNALAGRRLKPLGHPSKLPLLGSNQDSPDPESGVLPITPRGKLAASAAMSFPTYGFAEAGPTLGRPNPVCRQAVPESHHADSNRGPRHYE